MTGPSGRSVMTNVAVWCPADRRAFTNARDAKLFTRIGTRHSPEQVKAALHVTPQVEQTFYLTVNNVILVFDAAGQKARHDEHVIAVLDMLRANSMLADVNDCAFDVDTCASAGIRLQEVGAGNAYMVVNQGVQRRK